MFKARINSPRLTQMEMERSAKYVLPVLKLRFNQHLPQDEFKEYESKFGMSATHMEDMFTEHDTNHDGFLTRVEHRFCSIYIPIDLLF